MAYQADTLKNFLLNLRRNHSEFSSLPIQVVTKIISFLSWPDRIRVERVSRQFSEAAKAVWSLQTKLEIDERLNSFTKLSALLKRCGDQLEEISCRRNFLQQIAAEPIGRMCPKVKRLTFLSGTSLSLTKTILMGRPVNPSQDVITAQTYRFITSFSQLEAVQLLNSTATRQSAADEVVIPRSGAIPDLIQSLLDVPTMVELHTFSSFWWDIAELQHLRVLSIRVDRTADMVDAICQLRHLRELSMHLAPNERFITDYAVTMGNSLSHLESLIIVSAGSSEVTLMGTVIVEFRQLKTFLFIARLSRATEEQFRINLKPLRDRQVPINVFVNSRIRHLFTGDDGNVRLISMPNRRRGEALKFLRLYNCHGFDFNSQLCLKMMWSQVADGNWDLYSHEVEQADSSDVSSDPMDPYLVDVFGDSGEDEDIDSENSNEDEEEVG